jgi:4'-phosphopantetheinyl transferase EntD
MSADSDQVSSGRKDLEVAAPRVPDFAATALLRTEDTDQELHREEAALLHPSAVAKRRETFRLGRLAAHAALEAIGLDTGPILAGPHREPIWPEGVTGSISHVPGLAVAIVAPTNQTDGVGVDIESVRFAPELETQVPRPEERFWLDRLPQLDRDANIFSLFSAKESVFKAFYPSVGTFFGFQAASLVPESSGFVGRLVEDIDGRYPPTREFDIKCEWSGRLVTTWLVLPKTP